MSHKQTNSPVNYVDLPVTYMQQLSCHCATIAHIKLYMYIHVYT